MPQRHHAGPIGFSLEALDARQLFSIAFDAGSLPHTADGGRAVLADIDGDGRLDIVDSGSGFDGLTPRGLGFFRNLGDNTFAARQQLTSTSLNQITAGDFNGDGRTDLYGLVGETGLPPAILFNRGGLVFDRVAQPALPNTRIAFSANGDAATDIVAINEAGEVIVAIADANSDTGLTIVFVSPLNADPDLAPQLGDITRDGLADVLIKRTDDLDPAVLISLGDGQFTTGTSVLPAGDWNLVDYNSDGFADLWRRDGNRLIIRINESAMPPGSFLFGPDREVFRSASRIPTGFAPDLDGDNRPELLSVLVGPRQIVTYVHSSDRNGRYTISGDSLSSFDRFSMERSRDVGDLNGDGRADFLFSARNGSNGQFFSYVRFSRVEADPLADADVDLFIAPPEVVADGRLFLQARINPSADRPDLKVHFYIDSNGNGFIDFEDTYIGPSTTRDDSGLRNYFGNLPSGVSLGRARLIAAAGGATAFADVEIWTRSYHPGNPRADARLHQVVTIFNPTDAPVQFRLNARYQAGQPSSLIAQGRLGPGRTTTITIINPANPAANRVRANTPFALELLSAAPLAAALHTTDTRFGGTSADAFLSAGQTECAIADLSRARNDTITLYNPSLNPAAITIELFNAQGQGATHTISLASFRRATISIRALANRLDLTPRQVIIRSMATSFGQVPIVAGLFSAEPESGRLIARTAAPTADAPQHGGGLLLGPDHRSLITLQNPSAEEREVSVRIAYNGPTPGVFTRTYLLPARQLLTLDAGTLVPASARFGFVSSTSAPLSIRVVPRAGGDVAGLASTTAGTDWHFAGLQLGRRTATTGAGRTQFETLFLANVHDTRQTITLTFALPGGRTETRQFTLQPGRSRIVQLHAQSFFADTGGRYSLRVSAPEAIAAAVLHRDTAGQWLHSGAPIPAAT